MPPTEVPLRIAVTKEQMEEALKTSHDECHGKFDGSNQHACLHADAFADNIEQVQATIANIIMNPFSGPDPGMAVFFAGLHVGYRLNQLVNAPTPKEKVN